MSLIKVEIIDYNASYSYAPPTVDGVINTEEIVYAKPTTTPRRVGQFLFVKLRDGSSVTIVGTQATLFPARVDK